MPASLLTRESSWFKTWSQAGKQHDLSTAIQLIKKFEGLQLESYKCPAGVWTVGFGHTGPQITEGLEITEQQAEAFLKQDLERFSEGVDRLINIQLSDAQHCALVSFAFNIGLSAFETSTLRKRLNAGENPDVAVRAELPRWNKADGKILDGLTRRRQAEIDLFLTNARKNPLAVPYQSQLDNKSGTGYRECFSSSCAMLAIYAGKVKSDDEYNRIRSKFGDTTNPTAQVAALRDLGLTAIYRTNGTPEMIKQAINQGQPVAVGWLHQGPVSSPTGGGHWSVIIGYTDTHWIVNDPNGEANLVKGGYTANRNGAKLKYSFKNFNKRWMPKGNDGWMITVSVS